MTSTELDNLARIGKLKAEPPSARELKGLKAHERRNLADYEGHLEHDDRLLTDLLTAAKRLLETVQALASDGIDSA